MPTINEAVQQCIEYAVSYKIQLLDQEIRDIRLWPGIQWPSFKKGWIEWKPTLAGKLSQIVIIPIAIPLIIVLPLLECLTDIIDKWQRKRKLKKEQHNLKALSMPFDEVTPKNIKSLWRVDGIEERFGTDKQIHLIEKWVELLYGEDILKQFDLKARSEKIRRNQFKANTPYYKGEEDAPHFFFMSVAESLVNELAGELPPYEG
jgi:hypothetical protein